MYKVRFKKKHMRTFDQKNRSNLDPRELTSKVTTYTRPNIVHASQIITDMSQVKNVIFSIYSAVGDFVFMVAI